MAATAIYASLLNCDVGRLAEQVAELEESECIDGLHVDVMDGHFVPNLGFGPQSVETLRERTRLPIEVHLMVHRPAHLFPIFQAAGAQRLIVHAEASTQIHRDLQTIRELGVESGVALNPGTPAAFIESVLDVIDELLLMGVNPGFGGQSFITAVEQKVSESRRTIERAGLKTPINIDGGVKLANARRLASLGASRLVVGSALYGPPSIGTCAANFKALLAGEAA